MNQQGGVQMETKLVVILCRLAIAQMKKSIASPGLRRLLAGPVWKRASAQAKLALLDEQYQQDFHAASAEQKRWMKKFRQSIDDSLTSKRQV